MLLSVGLIPENELTRKLDIGMNRVTNGPVVNESLETSIPGVFACGNVLHVHDLVDYVSEEAGKAGINAAKFVQKQELKPWPEDKTNAMKKGLPEKKVTEVVFENINFKFDFRFLY